MDNFDPNIDYSMRMFNSIVYAIKEFINFNQLQKSDQDKWQSEIDKLPVGNDEAAKLYRDNKFTEDETTKIKKITERILKQKYKRDTKRKKEDEKEFNQLMKDKTKKYEEDYDEKLVETEGKENAIVFLLADRKRAKATEIMAKDFEENNSVYTTRDDERSECWIYKEGIYLPQARTYIKEYCRKLLGKLYTTNICNEVLNKIEADTFIEQEEFFQEEPPYLIAVNNGVLDLITKELKPFSPEFRFFSKLDINYIPSSDCPMIKKFFDSLFKDKNEINVIQELFGFLLYREYFLEKAFMFLGSGRNGKGKTMELMKHFIGVENCAEISLEAMEKDHFAIGELFKKYANLCGDLSKTALRHTGEFKKLTGRDLLSAARKFKTRVKFVNYAKMLFSCNDLPLTYDITEAFFNRWIILDFPYTFLPEKELNIIEEKDKENCKLRDTNIIEKISTEKEMEGLLCWALEGLERLRKTKSFSYSPSTNETKNMWLRKSDSCMAFIMDCIEEDLEGYVVKNDFRIKYAQYCREHKIRPSGDKVIKDLLISTFGAGEDRRYVDDVQEHVWVGIRFVEKGEMGEKPILQHVVSTDNQTQHIVPEEVVE